MNYIEILKLALIYSKLYVMSCSNDMLPTCTSCTHILEKMILILTLVKVYHYC